MSIYNVKISDAALKTVRETVGATNAIMNLKTGVMYVRDIDTIQQIVSKLEVDNVNGKPYQQVINNASAKEERNKLIGNDLVVGSVVRMKTKSGVKHAVIIAVNGNEYTVALLILNNIDIVKSGGVKLKKGKDIVYRNMTYKDVVTLMTYEVTFHLRPCDFINSSEIIVGKVINKDALNQAIEYANKVQTLEIPKQSEEQQALEQTNAELRTDEKLIDFLNVIENAANMDELMLNLGVTNEVLKQAINECVNAGRVNIKKLLPVLQQKYAGVHGRISQNALKIKLNEALDEWCENNNVELKDKSISYFLKAIINGQK